MSIFKNIAKTKKGFKLTVDPRKIFNSVQALSADDCWRDCCPECCCPKYVPCNCHCYWEVPQALPPRSNERWWGMFEEDDWYPGEYSVVPPFPTWPALNYRGGSWSVSGNPQVEGWYSEIRQLDGPGAPSLRWEEQVGPSYLNVNLVSPYENNSPCADPPFPGPPFTGDYLGNWIVQAQCVLYFPVKSCRYGPNPYGYGEIPICGSPYLLGVLEDFRCDTDPMTGRADCGPYENKRWQWSPFFPNCCAYWIGGSSGPLCADGTKTQFAFTQEVFFPWGGSVEYQFDITGIGPEHDPGCCSGRLGNCGPYEYSLIPFSERPDYLNY